MAIITNLSVPTEKSGNTATLMPKLAYRFRVSFLYDSDQLITSNVISFTRPVLSHEPVTIDAYNSKIKLAGKHTWEDVTMTLRDDVNSNVIKQIEAQIQKQIDMADQSATLSGANYKFQAKIESLDGANGAAAKALDTWILDGCYIVNYQPGENNYATSDATQISITISYDNATHTTVAPTGDVSASFGPSS